MKRNPLYTARRFPIVAFATVMRVPRDYSASLSRNASETQARPRKRRVIMILRSRARTGGNMHCVFANAIRAPRAILNNVDSVRPGIFIVREVTNVQPS